MTRPVSFESAMMRVSRNTGGKHANAIERRCAAAVVLYYEDEDRKKHVKLEGFYLSWQALELARRDKCAPRSAPILPRLDYPVVPMLCCSSRGRDSRRPLLARILL